MRRCLNRGECNEPSQGQADARKVRSFQRLCGASPDLPLPCDDALCAFRTWKCLQSGLPRILYERNRPSMHLLRSRRAHIAARTRIASRRHRGRRSACMSTTTRDFRRSRTSRRSTRQRHRSCQSRRSKRTLQSSPRTSGEQCFLLRYFCRAPVQWENTLSKTPRSDLAIPLIKIDADRL